MAADAARSAARLACPDPLVTGRALRVDGFEALQSAPTGLPRYAAARVVRALAEARPDEADLFSVGLQYSKEREFLLPQSHCALLRLATRAGLDLDAPAAAFVAPWAHDPAGVLRAGLGVAPNAAVAAAFGEEARRLRAAYGAAQQG